MTHWSNRLTDNRTGKKAESQTDSLKYPARWSKLQAHRSKLPAQPLVWKVSSPAKVCRLSVLGLGFSSGRLLPVALKFPENYFPAASRSFQPRKTSLINPLSTTLTIICAYLPRFIYLRQFVRRLIRFAAGIRANVFYQLRNTPDLFVVNYQNFFDY